MGGRLAMDMDAMALFLPAWLFPLLPPQALDSPRDLDFLEV